MFSLYAPSTPNSLINSLNAFQTLIACPNVLVRNDWNINTKCINTQSSFSNKFSNNFIQHKLVAIIYHRVVRIFSNIALIICIRASQMQCCSFLHPECWKVKFDGDIFVIFQVLFIDVFKDNHMV